MAKKTFELKFVTTLRDKFTPLFKKMQANMSDFNDMADKFSTVGNRGVSGFFSSVAKGLDKTNDKKQKFDKNVSYTESILNKIKFTFKKIKDVIVELFPIGQEMEETFLRFANITGSEKFGMGMIDWINKMQLAFPVAKEDLISFGESLSVLGVDPRKFNISGIIAGASGQGKQFGEVMNSITDIAKGNLSNITEFLNEFTAVPVNIITELSNTEIGMRGFSDRMNILLEVLNKSYSGNVERMNKSTKVLIDILKTEIDIIKQTIIGKPVKGTIFWEIRNTIQEIVNFMGKHRKTVLEFANAIGTGLNQIILFAKGIGKALFNFAKDLLGDFTKSKHGFVKDFVMPFITFLAILRVKTVKWFEGFLEGISPFIKKLKTEFFDPIVKWFKDTFGVSETEMKASGKRMGESLSTKLNDLLNLAKEWRLLWDEFWENPLSVATDIAFVDPAKFWFDFGKDIAVDTGKFWGNWIKDRAVDAFSFAGKNISKTITMIVDSLKEWALFFESVFDDIVEYLKKGLSVVINPFLDAISKLVSLIPGVKKINFEEFKIKVESSEPEKQLTKWLEKFKEFDVISERALKGAIKSSGLTGIEIMEEIEKAFLNMPKLEERAKKILGETEVGKRSKSFNLELKEISKKQREEELHGMNIEKPSVTNSMVFNVEINSNGDPMKIAKLVATEVGRIVDKQKEVKTWGANANHIG